MDNLCSIDGCQKKVYARGWCKGHYSRWLRVGDPIEKIRIFIPEICSIDGCSNPVSAKGWCVSHYKCNYRNGDPVAFKVKPTLKEKLNSRKVEVSRNYETPCWEYTRRLDTSGYGAITYNGKQLKVHRASYLEYFGDIPQGFLVCHKCDNPKCFNPEHLFLGTSQDNMDDMVKKGRSAYGENAGRTKLTTDQVKYILNYDFKFGDKTRLAKEFGITLTSIRYILQGKNWKYLTDVKG